jgi:hypothetical protein
VDSDFLFLDFLSGAHQADHGDADQSAAPAHLARCPVAAGVTWLQLFNEHNQHHEPEHSNPLKHVQSTSNWDQP